MDIRSLGANKQEHLIYHLKLTEPMHANLIRVIEAGEVPVIKFGSNNTFSIRFGSYEYTGTVTNMNLTHNIELLSKEDQNYMQDYGVVTKKMNFNLIEVDQRERMNIKAKHEQDVREKEEKQAVVLSDLSGPTRRSTRLATAPSKKVGITTTKRTNATSTNVLTIQSPPAASKPKTPATSTTITTTTIDLKTAPSSEPKKRLTATKIVDQPAPSTPTVTADQRKTRRASEPTQTTTATTTATTTSAPTSTPASAPAPPTKQVPANILSGMVADLSTVQIGITRDALRSSKRQKLEEEASKPKVRRSLPPLSPIRIIEVDELTEAVPTRVDKYEDFQRYYKKWTELYATYSEIHNQLAKNRSQFQQLGEIYSSEKDKSDVLKQIQQLYNERKEGIDRMRASYRALHEYLEAMSRVLNEYVERQLNA